MCRRPYFGPRPFDIQQISNYGLPDLRLLFCLKIFESNEIVDWTDADDDTALCPSCEIDSVIGDASGYPITREFLLKMQEYWF